MICPAPKITEKIVSGIDNIIPLNRNSRVGIMESHNIFIVLRPLQKTIQPNKYSKSKMPFTIRYTDSALSNQKLK